MDETISNTGETGQPNEPRLPAEAASAGITQPEWERYLAALDSPRADQTTNATLAYEIFGDKAEAYLNPIPESESEPRKYMRSDERRARIVELAREAHDSGDPNFWQKPEVRERAAELGMDIGKLDQL